MQKEARRLNDFSKQMEMVLYNSEDGDVSINAYIKDESLWALKKRCQSFLA